MLLCYTEFIGFGFSSTGPAEGLGAVWVLLLVVPLLMGPGAVYFWTTLEVVRSSQKAIFVCFIQVIHSFMVILAAEWTLRPIASRAFCTDSWRGKTACAFLKLLTLVPRRLYTQKIFPRYNICSAGILHISTQFGCEHALWLGGFDGSEQLPLLSISPLFSREAGSTVASKIVVAVPRSESGHESMYTCTAKFASATSLSLNLHILCALPGPWCTSSQSRPSHLWRIVRGVEAGSKVSCASDVAAPGVQQV